MLPESVFLAFLEASERAIIPFSFLILFKLHVYLAEQREARNKSLGPKP